MSGGGAGVFDPLNIGGGGGNSSLGNVGRDFTGKPSPESQEAALGASADATKFLTEMSKDYYNQTAGMRGGLINNLSRFISGNYDPTASPMYGPAKMTAERQYNTARNQVMSDTPTGGALYESLGNLQGQKANTMTDLMSKIISDEYGKAYSMGQGSQTVAAAGVQAGAQSSNDLIKGLAAQQSAGAQGTGNAVALIGGLLKYLAAA
jgi:hypothetical protein